MFNLFKSPEKFFNLAMWVISLLFASFLIGLGGKIIADLPLTTRHFAVDDFANRELINTAQGKIAEATQGLRQLQLKLGEARNELNTQTNTYQEAQAAHRSWLATRNATGNNPKASQQDQQDVDLLRRTQELENLGLVRRQSLSKIEQLQTEQLAAQRALQESNDAIARERERAGPEFTSALHITELKVFGLRLTLTLPLLAIAGWLIAKKRKSSYWPLYRGFVLFAAFAFFVELVPYLPSYGGYVRYIVGIGLSLVGAHYGIRWMQTYLKKRQAEAARNEQDRRATLDGIVAIQKMAAHLCPGCERPIATELDGVKVNHCVYCGLKLFTHCEQSKPEGGLCGVRKNAFFKFCPSCGGGS